MRIINLTRQRVLADNALVAGSFFLRLVGLLNRKELNPGEALILKPCNSIHTFLMRFTIDVLFVDKANSVVKTVPRLKPFRLTYIYPNSTFAIELPAGVIAATSTQQGDIISLE